MNPYEVLGKNLKMGRYAVVRQPTTFGPNCVLGDHAFVRENCTIGAEVLIGHNATVENNTVIGDRCRLQTGVYLTAHCVVGDDVFFGPYVVTTNDNHMGLYPEIENIGCTIGDRVRIGAGAIILPGIHIGEGATIAAGSIVTRDVPADALVMGSPAKVVPNA